MSDSFLENLRRERTKLQSERDRIDGQISGIDIALKLYANAQVVPHNLNMAPPRRSSVVHVSTGTDVSIKDFAFQLLAEFPGGMSSAELLTEAERRGRPLNRNTITSLLSASAGKNLLELVNGRYRIPEGVSGAISAPEPSDQPSEEAVEPARKVGGI